MASLCLAFVASQFFVSERPALQQTITIGSVFFAFRAVSPNIVRHNFLFLSDTLRKKRSRECHSRGAILAAPPRTVRLPNFGCFSKFSRDSVSLSSEFQFPTFWMLALECTSSFLHFQTMLINRTLPQQQQFDLDVHKQPITAVSPGFEKSESYPFGSSKLTTRRFDP